MTDTGYMLVALRRISPSKQENVGLTKKCHRMVVRPGEPLNEVAEKLQDLCTDKGTWRLYRSVNKRNFSEGLKLLQVEMILKPELIMFKVSSVWKSILMKNKCRAERKFLIDIDNDSETYLQKVKQFINDISNELILEEVKTPNGFHLVASTFDHRMLTKTFLDVEVKTDDLFFMKLWEND